MTKDEALRMALEALDFFEDTAICQADTDIATEAITAIKEALAQPKERNFCPRCGKRLGKNDWDIHTCTPPQRTWQGLTDEEIAQGCKESWVTEQAWQSAVWWAEEKLKEKNSA